MDKSILQCLWLLQSPNLHQLFILTWSIDASERGSVEFHNSSLAWICWYIRCDFADYNRSTHIYWIKYFLCPRRKFMSIWFLHCLCICPYVKVRNWFSYIPLCKPFYNLLGEYVCQRLHCLVALLCISILLNVLCRHPTINYWKWKSIIIFNSYFRFINWLFPIIGTSLTDATWWFVSLTYISPFSDQDTKWQ